MKNLIKNRIVLLTIFMIAFTNANSQCKSGDCTNGYGEYYWDIGEYYKGMFLNGERFGHGEYKFKSGDKYVGNWLNGEMNGRGTYYFKNGGQYDGDFLNNKFTGYGKISKKGDYYEGSYYKDSRHGFGTIYYENGDIYSGGMKFGYKHGFGILKLADVTTYVGQFNWDVMSGKMRKTDSSGKQVIIDCTNITDLHQTPYVNSTIDTDDDSEDDHEHVYLVDK